MNNNDNQDFDDELKNKEENQQDKGLILYPNNNIYQPCFLLPYKEVVVQ